MLGGWLGYGGNMGMGIVFVGLINDENESQGGLGVNGNRKKNSCRSCETVHSFHSRLFGAQSSQSGPGEWHQEHKVTKHDSESCNHRHNKPHSNMAVQGQVDHI